MPISQNLDREAGIFRIEYEGELSIEEQLVHLEGLLSSGLLPTPLRVLGDRRRVTNIGAPDNARAAVEGLLQHKEFMQGGRFALLVDRPASFGMARMFQALADNLPLEVGVFYELAEAEEWLLRPAP
jgi:hypothetical protein